MKNGERERERASELNVTSQMKKERKKIGNPAHQILRTYFYSHFASFFSSLALLFSVCLLSVSLESRTEQNARRKKESERETREKKTFRIRIGLWKWKSKLKDKWIYIYYIHMFIEHVAWHREKWKKERKTEILPATREFLGKQEFWTRTTQQKCNATAEQNI